MTTKDLKDYFGNANNFVLKTSLGRTSWFNWHHQGYVPIKSQHYLEEVTKGKLKADYKHARGL